MPMIQVRCSHEFCRPPQIARVVFMMFYVVLVAAAEGAFPWKTVRHDGRDYVTAKDIREYYKFDSLSKQGSLLIFRSSRIEMKISTGQAVIYINKVKFIPSYPIIAKGGDYLISQLDLDKLIDPVLRPSQIREAGFLQTVVIDPGHGGVDTGSQSRYGNESDFALRTALYLKGELEKRGFRVRMTRDDDSFPTLERRVSFANSIRNSIFVSIHFNSFRRTAAKGIETYALSPQGTKSYNSGSKPGDKRLLAGNARDSENIALATAVHAHVLKATGAEDRGIKRERYTVLTGIEHPAILLEGGFMSNPTEARIIATSSYQKKIAEATAQGIERYRNALRSRR
ncbi:MAG: N-acetylmuramoyl-L-alanine amidase [Verrucomicrobiota bacterium]